MEFSVSLIETFLFSRQSILKRSFQILFLEQFDSNFGALYVNSREVINLILQSVSFFRQLVSGFGSRGEQEAIERNSTKGFFFVIRFATIRQKQYVLKRFIHLHVVMMMDIFFTFGIYNFDRKRSKANASVIFCQLLLKFVSITLSVRDNHR